MSLPKCKGCSLDNGEACDKRQMLATRVPNLPLCVTCFSKVAELTSNSINPDDADYFRQSYCFEDVVLEAYGPVCRLLQKLTLLVPSEENSLSVEVKLLQPRDARRLIVEGHSSPLLIFLGAGASDDLGVPIGQSSLSNEVTVNERYMPIYVAATKKQKLTNSFYHQLNTFLASARVDQNVCIATTNIDGLSTMCRLGPVCLHGYVLNVQCTRCKKVFVVKKRNESESEPFGRCELCHDVLRFNICSFDDQDSKFIGEASKERSKLRRWISAYMSHDEFRILLVGCGTHVHSLTREALAIMSKRAGSNMRTIIFCLNTDDICAKVVQAHASSLAADKGGEFQVYGLTGKANKFSSDVWHDV